MLATEARAKVRPLEEKYGPNTPAGAPFRALLPQLQVALNLANVEDELEDTKEVAVADEAGLAHAVCSSADPEVHEVKKKTCLTRTRA